jgi:peptidoglycan/xylan/chitin deacetylase (PgdA/CDA1 family)
MNAIATTLAEGAAWVPMKWVRPISGVSLVVPFYHMVSDVHVPHVSNLYRFRSVAEFTADLEFFVRQFEPVSLFDIVEALDWKRSLPRSCFHLTFDDGFTEVYETVAPILEKFGVPATFFLNTGFLDGGGLAHYNAISVLLDRDELLHPASKGMETRIDSILPPVTPGCTTLQERIRSIGYAQSHLVSALAETIGFDLDEYIQGRRPHLTSKEVASLYGRGFGIGAHSHTHPLYAELSLAEQLEETRTSIDWLVSRFGVTPKAFAFPHNDTGVQEDFFSAVFSQHLLDVSFGTSGLVSHFNPRNIQRVSMEKTSAPASRILSRQFSRATYFRVRSLWGSPTARPDAANGISRSRQAWTQDREIVEDRRQGTRH